MQNFEDIEHLVSYMFEKLEGDEPVSVVADKNFAVEVMQELLTYNNTILNMCEIETSNEYDREYLVSLYNVTDEGYWNINVEKIYSYEKEKYFSIGGYVLFHEDVNSKALIDMQNNKFMPLIGHDWFVIGKDEETDNVDETDDSDEREVSTVNSETDELSTASKAVYKVNGRNVTKEEYDRVVNEIENKYLDNMRNMLLNYCEFIDEINEWKILLGW